MGVRVTESPPDPPRVSVRLLGGFEVRVNGVPAPTTWRLRKAQTLVQMLALAPRHQVSRDVVTELLWPERDPESAGNNLHQAVHAARRALFTDQVDPAELIAVTGDYVVLGPAAEVTVDVAEAERATATALQSGDRSALRAAFDAWSAELLPDEALAEWLAPHRDQVRNRKVAVAAAFADASVREGEAGEAVEVVRPLVEADPADESLQRQLLTALVAAGKRWEAFACYERLCSYLDTEFAARPDPETRALYRRLLGTAATGGAHNLPTAVSSFIGRHRELGELDAMLGRARLLTLTGPGGSGKTRLGTELARRRQAGGEHPDGVWLVDLAGLHDGGLVVSAAAAAVGVTLQRDRTPAALAERVSELSMLLVLDNCEHLLDDCVALVNELLARCADIVVIATSREPLGAPGEVVWRVPSLGVPDAEAVADVDELATFESVQLFVERAADSAPGFRLDATTARAIGTICRRLDGIPLALELAAARAGHLAVGQLAERLDDALTVLAHGGRGRLDRQQTIAATIDWSYELLDGDERRLFRRLALFAGGFDLAAAAAVTGDDISEPDGVLARLVDKSLINADISGEAARYEILEVVRQYAEARLTAAGELADCRRRHRRWFTDGAASRDPDLAGPVVLEPAEWFDAEQDNLRAALLSALHDEPRDALIIAVSTWRFWLARGQIAEGKQWLSEALAAGTEDPTLRRRAIFALTVFHLRIGDVDAIRVLARETEMAIQAERDPMSRGIGLHELSLATLICEEWDRAVELVAEIRSTVESPATRTSNENLGAVIALWRGNNDAALAGVRAGLEAAHTVANDAPPFYVAVLPTWVVDTRQDPPYIVGEETLVLGRRVGAQQARGYLLVTQSIARRLAGDVSGAHSDLDAAATQFCAVGDRYGEAVAINQRGHLLRWTGDLAAARTAFDQAEEIRLALRDPRPMAMTYTGQAFVDALLGDPDSARELASRATELMRRNGDGNGLIIALGNAAMVELALGDTAATLAALDAALDLGRRLAGSKRGVGWLELCRASLVAPTDPVTAMQAIEHSRQRFGEIGEQRGLAALARLAKRLQSATV